MSCTNTRVSSVLPPIMVKPPAIYVHALQSTEVYQLEQTVQSPIPLFPALEIIAYYTITTWKVAVFPSSKNATIPLTHDFQRVYLSTETNPPWTTWNLLIYKFLIKSFVWKVSNWCHVKRALPLSDQNTIHFATDMSYNFVLSAVWPCRLAICMLF